MAWQREDGFALLVERDRLRGRKQPVVDALEQRKARLRLHRLQRVADRGLRQRQLVRRRHRGAMADDGTQDLELTQVHITANYTLGQNIIAERIDFAAPLPRNGRGFARRIKGFIRPLRQHCAQIGGNLGSCPSRRRRPDGADAKSRYARAYAGADARAAGASGGRGASLVVFPELAFTTFFPRWPIEGDALGQYFERGMPNPQVQPLFDRARALARRLLCRLCRADAGRASATTAPSLVGPDGEILGQYRKVHLPGSVEPREGGQRYQQLEKRYFEYGDLGFPAVRGPDRPGRAGAGHADLQRPPLAGRLARARAAGGGAGDGSATIPPPTTRTAATPRTRRLRTFHSTLAAQANAYMNATWAVAVAKAGDEDGAGLIGGSCIVDPNGWWWRRRRRWATR